MNYGTFIRVFMVHPYCTMQRNCEIEILLKWHTPLTVHRSVFSNPAHKSTKFWSGISFIQDKNLVVNTILAGINIMVILPYSHNCFNRDHLLMPLIFTIVCAPPYVITATVQVAVSNQVNVLYSVVANLCVTLHSFCLVS